ncbi:hypothetical protein JX265_002315 [Neoarthrinium moseri]|uniref:Uncharacterized protein n=1 Tax=Neoarthrinium moseri TaxID=1658444 RepID=A0A9P9WUC4_9PEZI|nr:hypothetical protein JX266_000793 [Neoarthrinium moseri]KAI1879361.1 hypothetical protein JX265_002315 [Neoarthrinium moseri]
MASSKATSSYEEMMKMVLEARERTGKDAETTPSHSSRTKKRLQSLQVQSEGSVSSPQAKNQNANQNFAEELVPRRRPAGEDRPLPTFQREDAMVGPRPRAVGGEYGRAPLVVDELDMEECTPRILVPRKHVPLLDEDVMSPRTEVEGAPSDASIDEHHLQESPYVETPMVLLSPAEETLGSGSGWLVVDYYDEDAQVLRSPSRTLRVGSWEHEEAFERV